MNYNTNANQNTAEQQALEINFKDIFFAVIGRYKLISVLAVVMALCSFLISEFVMVPKYQATVTMVINNTQTITSDGLRSDDITASISLIPTYIELMQSNNVLGEVAAKTQDLGYTADDILGMLNISSYSETQIIVLSVTNTNPEHANIIANAMASVVPDRIVYLMEGTSVKVIDASTIPEFPVSPNVKNNTVLGFLAGAFIGFAIAALIALLDNSIKKESDISDIYPNLPILGTIPEFTSEKASEKPENTEESEDEKKSDDAQKNKADKE